MNSRHFKKGHVIENLAEVYFAIREYIDNFKENK